MLAQEREVNLTMQMMKRANEQGIVLRGCTPTPLASYLKALGVLRVLSEQFSPSVRAMWNGENYHLTGIEDETILVDFFLDRYQPTPIIAPWNGGSGFWGDKTSSKVLAAIEASSNPRLEDYRKAIEAARKTITGLNLTDKPDKKQKQDLMRLCRAAVPDAAVQWLDAAFVLSDDKPKYPALLGTGANDGNMDFAANFMQNLTVVIDLNPGQSDVEVTSRRSRKRGWDRSLSQGFLRDALFGMSETPLVSSAVGQFNPGAVGGPNGTRGFEAGSLLNPWDFILALEGSLMFAGSVVWRLGTSTVGMAAFPFSVNPSTAGAGSASQDGLEARAETWVPLWSRPSSYRELQRVFSEGRAQVGSRRARNGTDFVRAIAGLGVDRGISSFVRYSFMQRSGLAYLGVPLGRFRVTERPSVNLMSDLDPWLDSMRRLAGDSKGPGSFRRVLRQMEDSIFAYCAHGRKSDLLAVLASVGRGERLLAQSNDARRPPSPLARLRVEWARECADAFEFRLALSLASIHDPKIGHLRTYLEPVEMDRGRWKWSSRTSACAPYGADLAQVLEKILERRVLDGDREGLTHAPIGGAFTVSPSEVSAFLAGQVDDDRVLDLLWAASAISFDRSDLVKLAADYRPRGDTLARVPRAYALLKLLMLPKDAVELVAPRERDGGMPFTIRPEPVLFAMLRAGRVELALEVAVRRLRASGLMPIASGRRGVAKAPEFLLSPTQNKRLAASLLFPVSNVRGLANLVIRPSED
jgi:CRISPR-associated protein Csx17